jgi:hypothetical protein
VCVDGLELADFDFVDIGARVAGRPVVPVIVKSLVFPDADPAGSELCAAMDQQRPGSAVNHKRNE